MVLFGGFGGPGSYFADTWEYDGNSWSQVTATVAPPARFGHGLAYDSARACTVLFGGLGSTLLNDTWTFDGTTWSQVATTVAPQARYMAALAYGIARGRTALYGGNGAGVVLADTWEFDGGNWSQITTALAPAGRSGHAMAYDSARDRIVLCGGDTNSTSSDPWELVPAATAAWARHGTGCAGSAGTPSLDRTGNAVPSLGTTFPLQFTSLPAQPGVLYFAFGFGIAQWQGAPLPIDLGTLGLPTCKLWIAPESALLLPHPGGSVGFPLTIPAAPALADLRVALQACVFDAAAPNGIGAVTNAGILTLH